MNVREWASGYVQNTGAPRTGPCRIELGDSKSPWVCWTHDIGYKKRDHLLDGRLNDRCPVARLEAWRARRWAAADWQTELLDKRTLSWWPVVRP